MTGAEVAAAVEDGEIARLLGMRGRPLEGLVAERTAWARAWYAAHGRPFVAARRHAIASLDAESARLANGLEMRSGALADTLRRWDAHALLALAVSAGPEVDAACEEMWKDDRPDEGYFLERFAVAVVERLVFTATLGACQAAEGDGETLTPHLSPGCGSWGLDGQHALWAALFPDGAPGPLALLESGALSPKVSLLAAMGVTRRSVSTSRVDACRRCALPRCAFRRAPYGAPLEVIA